ncbi:MAG: molecular chaperone GrpE [Acidimicrobiaceae bacterium]|jgi:molecular chaperone GrpE|nr:molecular chaperone GrpE [Acidimicrobiaceae bacterium]
MADEAVTEATAEGAGAGVEEAAEQSAQAVEQAAEAVEQDIAALAAERDEFKALAQRIQADFENYKKRIMKQQTEHLERAAETLVAKLLPVLDTADLAVAHGGGEAVEQVWLALSEALAKEGLERIDPKGDAFDPTRHEAVMHEEGEGGPTVSDVMRAGYAWKGRVLRPAMVKVTG